jgi:hypothetical protein
MSTNRPELGPSIRRNSEMALIAREDAYVEDADGIRRKISAGAPVPGHLAAGFRDQVDEVDTRSLARPVVDEESQLSHAERTKRAQGGRQQQQQQQSAKKGD